MWNSCTITSPTLEHGSIDNETIKRAKQKTIASKIDFNDILIARVFGEYILKYRKIYILIPEVYAFVYIYIYIYN